MCSFKTVVAVVALGGVVFASADRAHANNHAAYRAVVLADNPAIYYEFNEDEGAIQTLDTTTNTYEIDGVTTRRHSQFVGQRTRQRAVSGGFSDFALNPGKNVIFGQEGPFGRFVEFNDPNPGFGSDNEEGNGGYIETGLHKNFGPNSGDYTIEFIFRDEDIVTGWNRAETIVSQGRADELAVFTPFIDENSGLEITERFSVGTPHIDFDPYDCGGPACSHVGVPSIGYAQNAPGLAGGQPGELTGSGGGGNLDPSGTASSGVVPVQGKWTHVVQTFESGVNLAGSAGNGVIRYFIDGVAEASFEIVGESGGIFDPGYNDNDSPFLLGINSGASAFHPRFYYDGFLDEFAVYDVNLNDPNGDGNTSDSRIAAHADAFAAVLASFDSADFDFDNDVDGADFLAWQRAVGPDTVTIEPDNGGTGDANAQLVDFGASAGGDANGDNLSDGADLAIWGGQFGATGALAAATGVPEPSTGLLAGSLLALATLARRRVGAS